MILDQLTQLSQIPKRILDYSFEKKKGMAPGSVVFLGKQKMEEPKIELIEFTADTIEEKEKANFDDLAACKENKTIKWINVFGLHDTALINKVGELFEINPLILEDIVDTHQRPRLEEFDKNLFWLVKMLQFDKNEKRLESEQVSIVIGSNVLITFQEKDGDLFEPVRVRLRNSKGKIRAKGADYLAYALVDTLVDNYIILAEHLAEKIEQMEAMVLKEQKPDTLQAINSLKQEVSFFRRTVRPLRESIIMLIKSEHSHVQKHVIPYLKDLLDLTNHVTEVTEVHAEMLNDQLNIFHMTVSYRLNEVIRVLTIFSVIFIPLTFLAGIYGTNFEYLPELKYRYSYFIFWGVMISLAAIMLWYFKRKKWL